MTTNSTKYGILVGVDGSADSDAAVAWATHEAIMRHAHVTLAHVVQPVVASWPIAAAQLYIANWQRANADDVIEQARKIVQASAGQAQPPEVSTQVRYSNVVPVLIDASKQAQMVVTGSRGMGAVGRLLLGSVSAALVRHAHCPVAVIRAGEDSQARPDAPVLLGIDGSPASEAATALAYDEASRRGVPLVALHAWSDVGVFPILGMDWRQHEAEGHEILGERLAGWQERYPDVTVQSRLVCDQPARWLIEESQHAQLVVVGSHGRGGFPGMLLGSASSAVAQSAKAPVIVVRGK
jgi:nucleotide-binding universal stress UspA family protein